jgi:hypothetical protein
MLMEFISRSSLLIMSWYVYSDCAQTVPGASLE